MTLEEVIAPLVGPINGQRPRPWFTHYTDPERARVFIVGMNQASQYQVDAVSHDEHLDALFNRGGLTCEGLYQRLGFEGKSRAFIDRFCTALSVRGIDDVLQTNVVCYATPKTASVLSRPQHRNGRARGKELFRTVVAHVKPRIIVVHGQKSSRELKKALGVEFEDPPSNRGPATSVVHATRVMLDNHPAQIIAIPTLAKPGVNSWMPWQSPYFDTVARHIETELGR